jgi:hypothetical protein
MPPTAKRRRFGIGMRALAKHFHVSLGSVQAALSERAAT